MEKVIVRDKEFRIKGNIGVLLKNFSFFNKLENPLADPEIAKQVKEANDEYHARVKQIGKEDLPEDIKKDLLDTEKDLWKAKVDTIKISSQVETSDDVVVLLMETAVESDEKIDWKDENNRELAYEIMEEVKKNTDSKQS